VSQEVPEGAPNCLAGLTFVISGTLDRCLFTSFIVHKLFFLKLDMRNHSYLYSSFLWSRSDFAQNDAFSLLNDRVFYLGAQI
jgi:hypothetical protein